MPIDPTGTSPQPTLKPEEEKILNMRCKRPGCDSITAIQIKIPGSDSQRIYRCKECMHTWGLNVGGHIDI